MRDGETYARHEMRTITFLCTVMVAFRLCGPIQPGSTKVRYRDGQDAVAQKPPGSRLILSNIPCPSGRGDADGISALGPLHSVL